MTQDKTSKLAGDRGFDRARVAATGADANAPSPPEPRAVEGEGFLVEEATGNAAAEATGKLQVDNDAPPEATAGSG